MSAKLRLVLLGGTGFVGSAVRRRLAARGGDVEVRALVRGDRGRLHDPCVTAVSGALPNVPSSLFPAEPFVLVHLATKQIDHDGSGFHSNSQSVHRLVEVLPPACRGIVYGSSVSVYGHGAQEGVRESAPLRPATPLARARACCEAAILTAAAQRSIGAVVFRPRFVIGQGDRYTLPGIARMLRRGFLVGSGRQAFSLIDVDDYAALIVRGAERLNDGLREPLVVHAAYERPIALDEIAAVMCDELAIPLPRWKLPIVPWLVHSMSRAPHRYLSALGGRLDLLGFSHYVDVERLIDEFGRGAASRDPRSAVRAALCQSSVALQPPVRTLHSVDDGAQ